MIEGTRSRATRTPFTQPTSAPATSARRKPGHPTSKVWKHQVNTNPDSATTAGKLRSISPAVITNVSPTARTSIGGTVWKNDM